MPIEDQDDLFLLEHVVESARAVKTPSRLTPDRWLEERDQVEVGGADVRRRALPGHSPGSVVFLNAAQHLAIVGDVLFAGSVGRTDLPGGDRAPARIDRDSSCPWRTMLRSSADTADDDHRRDDATNPFFNCSPRLPVNALVAPRRLAGRNAAEAIRSHEAAER